MQNQAAMKILGDVDRLAVRLAHALSYIEEYRNAFLSILAVRHFAQVLYFSSIYVALTVFLKGFAVMYIHIITL